MLVSGSGSNLQALLDDQVDYRIVVVIADRPEALGLERASRARVPTAVVPWDGDRGSFTRRICDEAQVKGARALVLAGFMRILGPEALDRFPAGILNIHPSLLPAFPGNRAVVQALAAGVATTGVTVHFVDEQVDHGPIIAQEEVAVFAGDTEASLHARIQEHEHRLYPEVVGAFARGEIRLAGRSVDGVIT
ncbi:phosphoribosylglycinamide formyltransferase [soil metagenome]